MSLVLDGTSLGLSMDLVSGVWRPRWVDCRCTSRKANCLHSGADILMFHEGKTEGVVVKILTTETKIKTAKEEVGGGDDYAEGVVQI